MNPTFHDFQLTSSRFTLLDAFMRSNRFCKYISRIKFKNIFILEDIRLLHKFRCFFFFLSKIESQSFNLIGRLNGITENYYEINLEIRIHFSIFKAELLQYFQLPHCSFTSFYEVRKMFM